ncbi:hypothetical protein NUM3379_42500 [Kineococcus sp. NUM-3379]
MTLGLRFEIFPADLERTVRFYTDVLGFDLVQDDRPAGGRYVALVRDEVRIGAAEHSRTGGELHRLPPAGVELVLEVDDLAGERDRVLAAGGVLAADLALQPWGLRDVRLTDPDGYLLRLTDRRPRDEPDWGSAQLDLDGYLTRIGLDGPLRADAGTLGAVHRAHVARIPFENLDVLLHGGVSVALPDVQDKLVRRRRGGYCYEQNLLLAAALERLGFRVTRLLARVEGHRARTHLVLRVEAQGRAWLADAGFGSGLLEPLPLREGAPVRQGGWELRLVRAAGGWRLEECVGGRWQARYAVDAVPQEPADVEMSNHYTGTWPASPFRSRLVLVRKDEREVRRLLGRTLGVLRPDGGQEERVLTDAEVLGELRGAGIELDAADSAALLERLG